MAIKESDIKKLFKTIMQDTMKTVSAGQKTVIAPTQVRNIAKEIISEAESGNIEKFERALNKTEKIIEKLGYNISDFNKSLGKRIEELRTQRDTSAKEVEELRSKNIAAEVRSIKEGKEFRIETHILTKNEIKERKQLLEQNTKRVDNFEKQIIKKREAILKGDEVTQDQKEKILSDERKLAVFREKLQKEEQTLSPLQKEEGPGELRSTFYEELKAPFAAIGDAFMSIKDAGMEVYNIFLFFKKGGFMKSLKSVRDGMKAIGRFFMSTKVLIGLAIGAVIAGLFFFRKKIGDAAEFLMSIPGKIADFFKTVFVKVTDFFKSMINSVIKLVNKIPGINIPLLETSSMKEEKEKKEKNKRIKDATAEGEMAAAVTQTNVSDFDDDTAKTQKAKGYEDGLATDSIYYGDVAKGGNLGIKSPADKRKEKLEKFDEEAYIKASEEKYGSSIAPFELRDREKFKFMRTGKITDPNELKEAQLENDKLKQSAPPVIVTNANKSTNISSSGTSVTGFMSNKNVDDTFINLNTVSV